MTRIWLELAVMSLWMAFFAVFLAHAQTGQTVIRVQLPDGRILETQDTTERRWWQAEELKGLGNSFYFDPEQNVYKVTGTAKNWPSPERWDRRDTTGTTKVYPAHKAVIWDSTVKTETPQTTVPTCPPESVSCPPASP